MFLSKVKLLLSSFVIVLASISVLSPPKVQAAETDQWNLTEIYPTQSAWDQEAQNIREILEKISIGRTQNIGTPEDLAKTLDLISDARGRAAKMAKVGLLLSFVDTNSEEFATWREQGELLENEVESSVSFLNGLLLEIGEEKLLAWLQSSHQLKQHERRILRTLFLNQYAWPSEAAEFEAHLIRLPRTANDFYVALRRMDMDWPELDGISLSPYSHSAATRNADDQIRRTAYELYLNFLSKFSEPYALALTRRIEGDLVIAETRNLVDSVDTLLVLQDGLKPQTHQAILPSIKKAKPQIRVIAEALRQAYGLVVFSLDDVRARKLQLDLNFDIDQAHDLALRAANLISPEYAELMASRLEEPWTHLSNAPNKSSSTGVFWQAGGGNPHTIFKFQNNLGSSQLYSAAAFTMMAYSELPEERAPDRREEDFPVFGNAIWALGAEMHDMILLSGLSSKQDQIALLANQLARSLRFLLVFYSMVDLEVKIGEIIKQGKVVSADQISELYWESLQEIFGDTGIVIPEYWRYSWMDGSFAFYGPHYSSFVLAEVTKLLLKDGINRKDPAIKHIVSMGMAESDRHFSIDVLTAAGIDLSNPESYQAAFREIENVANQLLAILQQ